MRTRTALLSLIALALPGHAARAGDFDLLFIHHSVGSNWLNNGLRSALQDPAQNLHVFRVHDATYGDTIGNDTDVRHWYPKFRDQMGLVRTFDRSRNVAYTEAGRFNRIVLFKSCYPNSAISSVGTAPGDPVGAEHTLWNHKAAYNACAGLFQAHPTTLFVALTAPPLNPAATGAADAARAREFHTWLGTTWVSDYAKASGLGNVAAFDLFDVLANPPTHPTEPNMLAAAYRSGTDSHPTAAGDQAATRAFLPFLAKAVESWLASLGGCPGSGGRTPVFLEYGLPKVGNPGFGLVLSGARPGAAALALIGPAGARTPLGGGCSLALAPPFLGLLFQTAASGAGQLPLPIPGDSALRNLALFLQALVLDPAGSLGPGVLALSNGLAVRIL